MIEIAAILKQLKEDSLVSVYCTKQLLISRTEIISIEENVNHDMVEKYVMVWLVGEVIILLLVAILLIHYCTRFLGFCLHRDRNYYADSNILYKMFTAYITCLCFSL